jgi:hypothetical protein
LTSSVCIATKPEKFFKTHLKFLSGDLKLL